MGFKSTLRLALALTIGIGGGLYASTSKSKEYTFVGDKSKKIFHMDISIHGGIAMKSLVFGTATSTGGNNPYCGPAPKWCGEDDQGNPNEALIYKTSRGDPHVMVRELFIARCKESNGWYFTSRTGHYNDDGDFVGDYDGVGEPLKRVF